MQVQAAIRGRIAGREVVDLLETNAEIDDPEGKHAAVRQVDTNNVLRSRSEAVAGIRRTTPVQIAESQGCSPLTVVRINHHPSGGNETGVVVSTVTDDPAAVGVATLVDRLPVTTIVRISLLNEIAARARQFRKPAVRPSIRQVSGALYTELYQVSAWKAARLVFADKLAVGRNGQTHKVG